MKNNLTLTPRVARIVVITIVLAIGALGYAWYDARFPSWREEVRLSDGRVISVNQKRDFIEGRGTRRTWLTFSLPEMGGEQTWEQLLYPSIIDVADGKVYVIGRPRGSLQFRFYGYPKYVYVAYAWRNGTFERIPFMSVPERLRRAENVYWCLPPSDHSNISLEIKNKRWCENIDTAFPTHKQVDIDTRTREALDWAQSVNIKPQSE